MKNRKSFIAIVIFASIMLVACHPAVIEVAYNKTDKPISVIANTKEGMEGLKSNYYVFYENNRPGKLEDCWNKPDSVLELKWLNDTTAVYELPPNSTTILQDYKVSPLQRQPLVFEEYRFLLDGDTLQVKRIDVRWRHRFRYRYSKSHQVKFVRFR
ncbi:MAG: hypothetical protein KDC92_03140 [Bacteroidetes bacterium]|nr:hypothetical protein [Bacteroidota bacterium]